MNNKVYVGNISYNLNTDDLKQAFFRSGTVTDVKIMVDRETGLSRGFGFVTFESSDHAFQAIQDWNGQELDGRRLVVNEAQERQRQNGIGYRVQNINSTGYAPRFNNGVNQNVRDNGGPSRRTDYRGRGRDYYNGD